MKLFLHALVMLLAASGARAALDPVAALAEAQEARAEKKFDRALALLTQLIAEQPASSEGFIARGYVFLAQGQRDAAATDFKQAVIADPTNARAYLIRGDLAHRLIAGDFAACEADYATVLRLDPEFPHFHAYSAELYLYLRNPERVLAEALQGLLREPTSPIHKINLGHGLAFSGHVAAAKVVYGEVGRTEIERGLTGAKLALGDYAQLKKRGIDYPQMAELTPYLESLTSTP